jgi:hypothetical protein
LLIIADLIDSISGALGDGLGWLRDALADAGAWLLDALGWAVAAVGHAFQWLVEAGGDAFWWLVHAVDWLGSLLDPAGEILARIWPGAIAAIAAIALLRTVRWLLLLWRGRTSRVQISPFAWAAQDKDDREATWVTSLFREQLAALRLDALDPLPERAPGAPLVEIVEGVGQGVGRSLDIAKALGKLYRAVWPDAAYEVWGTLRPHEDGSGRISVQLVERRGGNRTLLNVALDKTGWEKGAREAAMAVAGALYPRVRRHDRGPWTMWSEAVPRELMADYHAAREHEEANRLEHALDRYHAALDEDPLNPNLRLKIAMLQERLELDLDAWVTFEAIVDESDRRAWRGPDRRVYLLALYRLAILLSNGRVPTQWAKNDAVGDGDGSRRDDERSRHRRELMLSLERNTLLTKKRALPTWNRFANASAAELIAELRSAGGETGIEGAMLRPFKGRSDELEHYNEERAQLIDAVLQIVSLRRLEELDAWLRVRPPARPRKWKDWWVHRPAMRQWLSRREFSRSAVGISKLLVRIRIAASLERRYLESPKPDESQVPKIRKAHRRLAERWPFPPVGLRKVTHFLAPRRRWANRRKDAWQLHYNAACATASILREDSVLNHIDRTPKPTRPEKMTRSEKKEQAEERALPDGIEKDDVIEQAIAELEEYAYRAGSERVAAQADWLAIYDPDLEGLRRQDAFTLWANHHLPRGLPPDEPRRKSDVKRYTIRVVHQGARALAESWRERADSPEFCAEEIAAWWREERRAWETLRTTCREHLSWSERLNGLKALQGWLVATEKAELVDFGHETRGDTTASAGLTDELLDRLAELAGDRRASSNSDRRPPTVLPWVSERVSYVRDAYEQGEARADANGALRAAIERREALRASRIWARLADALAAELHEPRPGGEPPDLDERLNRVRSNLPGGSAAGDDEGDGGLVLIVRNARNLRDRLRPP